MPWAVFGLAVLYFWLRGHWFARAVTFLALVPTVIVCVGKNAGPSSLIGAVVFCAAAVVIAWFLSGLPIYLHAIWRRRSAEFGQINQAYEAPRDRREPTFSAPLRLLK